MSRSQRSVSSDVGQPDGQIFIPVTVTDVNPAVQRLSIGGVNFVNLSGPSTAYVITNALNSSLLLRYGAQCDLQEAFGNSLPVGAQGLPVGWPTTNITAATTPGRNVSVPVLSSAGFTPGMWCMVDVGSSQEPAQINAIPDATHIQFALLNSVHNAEAVIAANLFTTPAGVSGSPPFQGVSQFTPVTSPRPKGIKFKQFNFVYSVLGASSASVNNASVQGSTFSNNQPFTLVDFLATSPAPLETAPLPFPQFYVTPVPVQESAQVFLTNRNTHIQLIWNVTNTALSGVFVVGVFVDVEFNWN